MSQRLRVSLGALTAMALSLLATWQMADPARALAIDCFCTSFQNTPTETAKGASCAIAENKLWNKASALMDCGLNNTCSPVLVITTACYWDSAAAAYRVYGHINYGCLIGSECP
jgi:hypothetical protein